jgi:hypothetical protein
MSSNATTNATSSGGHAQDDTTATSTTTSTTISTDTRPEPPFDDGRSDAPDGSASPGTSDQQQVYTRCALQLTFLAAVSSRTLQAFACSAVLQCDYQQCFVVSVETG